MPAYWFKFEDGGTGCIEAETQAEAEEIAETKLCRTTVKCDVLPYPAQPRLHVVPDPEYGPCPSFCYTPETCAGKTSCPHRYSCVE